MTAPEPRSDHANLRTRWLGPFIILLVGIVDAWWSWRKWPDVLVDFGRELYAAWQLSAGKTLYTDVAWFKGPFSPYLNALWFRLFGVSVTTLIVCNLVILGMIVYLLYQILLLISDRLSATIGCVVFLTLFAFSQFIAIGNYNFVCPYSHECTHGILLSLSGIWCLRIYLSRRGLPPIAGAGILLGLVFLTSAEMSLAACLAMTTGLGLTLWQERPGAARVIRDVGLFVGCAVIPPAIGFSLLCLKMPSKPCSRRRVGFVDQSNQRKSDFIKFYRDLMGTSNITISLKAILSGSDNILSCLVWPPQSRSRCPDAACTGRGSCRLYLQSWREDWQ